MAREVSWFPPGGDPLILTDRAAGYRVTKGVRGHGAAPVDISVDSPPEVDGGIVTDVWAPPRTVQIPLLVLADDTVQYRQRIGALLDAMSHGQECQLQIAQPDGSRRRIRAYYQSGLEGLEDRDTGGETWYRCVLTLFCPDPWWFDPTPVSVMFRYQASAPSWFPLFPLNLGASAVLGVGSIINPGQVLSWPEWTITPPGNTLNLTNVDTGEALTLNATAIPGGDTLRIITEPTKASIALGSGTDWWDKITGIPHLWSLRRGANNVNLSLAGAGVGSSIGCTFTARYRSAW
jgi:hypothetical protein